MAIALLSGLIIAASIVIVGNYPPADGFVLSNGKLLGGDFIAFYTAGKMSSSSRELLYDFNSQKEFRSQILGPASRGLEGELPFVHPPLVAWMFSPLASLSFQKAFYCWLAASLILSLGGLLLLARELRILNLPNFALILLGAFAFVPYGIECLMGGQLASLGVLIYSLLFILLRRDKDFLAGLIASLAYYKPPYFVLSVLALIFSRPKSFLFGFLAGSLTLIGLTVALTGISGFGSYLSVISHYRYGQELMEGVKLPPQHGVGIYGLITIITSQPWSRSIHAVLFVLMLKTAVKYLGAASRTDKGSFSLAYVFAMVSSLALSVQLAKYDLSILLVSFMILAAYHSWADKYMKWVGLMIAGFYLEFIFRGTNVKGLVMHASSFLFIPYLFLIYLVQKNFHRQEARSG